VKLPSIGAEAFSAAQRSGYAAFVFGMACFAQADDRRFKLFMALECAAYLPHFALHFALPGQPTAVASTAVSLLRSLASLQARKPWVGSVGGRLLEAGLAVSNLWTISRLARAAALRRASPTRPG
jgi:hypothetical protein